MGKYAKLVGDKRLIKTLQQFARKVQNKAIKKSLQVGAKIMVKAIKSEVPQVDNVLRKSESYKIFGKGLSAEAIMGSDVGKMVAPDDGGHSRPSNLDSLIEFGFQHESGQTVPGQYPLKRGAGASQRQAQKAVVDKLRDEIDKAV